jgi:hypothetical protein
MMNIREKHLLIAELIDAYRIFPRIFFGAYIFLFIYAGMWAMSLPALSATQAGLVGTIITAGAAWSKFYNDTGREYGDKQCHTTN